MQSEKTSAGGMRLLVLLFLICLLLYGAGSARTGYTGADELRYAEVAKEMDSFEHLFYLRYQGNPYPDKPPLFFWTVKIGYLLGGAVEPWALRAPLILSTLLTVLLTYGIGKTLFDERIALMGAAFYGLCFRVTWSAHMARLDPPLVLFTTLALYLFVRQLKNVEAGQRPSTGNVLGFWTAIAMGFLIKGPLALLVPLLTIALYRLVRRKWKAAFGWSSLAGIGLFLMLILGLYILPAAWFGRHVNYIQTIFGQEVVQRSTNPWRHVKDGLLDPVYYIGRMAVEFLPGSLFLPGAIGLWFVLWRRRRLTPELVFVWLWFAGIFLFFTLMRSKRGQYILPLYPAAGLLIGHFVATVHRENWLRKGWFWKPLWLYAAYAAALAVALHLPVVQRVLAAKLDARPGGEVLLLWTAALLVCSAGMILWIVRRNAPKALLFACGIIPGIIIPAFLFYFPEVYDDTRERQMTEMISYYARRGDRIFMFRAEPQWGIYGNFYFSEFDAVEAAMHLGVPTTMTRPVFSNDGLRQEETQILVKTEDILRHDNVEAFFASDEPRLAILSGTEYAEMPMEYPGSWPYLLEVFPFAADGKEGGARLVSNRPAHEWIVERPE